MKDSDSVIMMDFEPEFLRRAERLDAAANFTPDVHVLTAEECSSVFGVTKDEYARPEETMVSGGVLKLHQGRVVLSQRGLDNPLQDDDAFEISIEKYPLEEQKFRRMRREQQLDSAATKWHTPAWMTITGFDQVDERELDPVERERRIWKLVDAAEKILRYEMKRSVAAPSDDEFSGKRRYMWDPLRNVCFHMGISQRRLTTFMKEVSGESALDMVDRLRWEFARERMKKELVPFVAAWFEKSSETSGDEVAELIYEALQESRRAPRFHRTQWAAQFGFPS